VSCDLTSLAVIVTVPKKWEVRYSLDFPFEVEEWDDFIGSFRKKYHVNSVKIENFCLPTKQTKNTK
jgi:hypothetical protein